MLKSLSLETTSDERSEYSNKCRTYLVDDLRADDRGNVRSRLHNRAQLCDGHLLCLRDSGQLRLCLRRSIGLGRSPSRSRRREQSLRLEVRLVLHDGRQDGVLDGLCLVDDLGADQGLDVSRRLHRDADRGDGDLLSLHLGLSSRLCLRLDQRDVLGLGCRLGDLLCQGLGYG